MRFSAWLFEWLSTYKIHVVKPSTYDRYVQLLRTWCAAAASDCEIDELRLNDVQRTVNTMYTRGLSSSVIRQSVCLVRQSLKTAYVNRMVTAEAAVVCEYVQIPVRRAKEVQPLNVFAVRRLLDELDGIYFGTAIAMLLHTGMRVGELLALRWSDVALDTLTISISRTDYRGRIQSCKTFTSIRTIPISNAVHKLLLTCRTVYGHSELVVCNRYGGAADYRAVLEAWYTLCDRIDVERCGLHTLRHTYATQALRSGVDPVTIAKLLGHSDATLVLRRYCTSDLSDMRRAVSVINF